MTKEKYQKRLADAKKADAELKKNSTGIFIPRRLNERQVGGRRGRQTIIVGMCKSTTHDITSARKAKLKVDFFELLHASINPNIKAYFLIMNNDVFGIVNKWMEIYNGENRITILVLEEINPTTYNEFIEERNRQQEERHAGNAWQIPENWFITYLDGLHPGAIPIVQIDRPNEVNWDYCKRILN
jgi:hypothetical protein